MNAQSTIPVEATVTIQLFTDEDGEDAGMVAIDGHWPEDRALSRALCLVSQYLARRVNAEFSCSQTEFGNKKNES